MPPRKKSDVEIFTEQYIEGAVKVHVKASEVPPREKLDIKFNEASKLSDSTSATNQEAYEESHGKLYEMTHNNTVPWRNWAFYLILLSLLTVCFTFAKYVSFASGDAKAAVAKFEVSVTGEPQTVSKVTVTPNTTIPDPGNGTENVTIVFEEDSDPEASEEITFTVQNDSQVTIKVLYVKFKDGTAINHDYRFIGPANTATQNRQALATSDFVSGSDNGYITAGNYKDFKFVVDKADHEATDTNLELEVYIEQVD